MVKLTGILINFILSDLIDVNLSGAADIPDCESVRKLILWHFCMGIKC